MGDDGEVKQGIGADAGEQGRTPSDAERKTGPKRSEGGSGEPESSRSRLTLAAMVAGLAGGYGLFGFIAARFLYPAKPRGHRWMFVTESARLAIGDSILYRAPGGETINITRRARENTPADFIALSSVCPHLGCQVHWEPHNDRYFCPCHNGVFDRDGVGVAGPPGDEGMTLSSYDLRLDNDLLFIAVPAPDTLSADARGEILERAPGVCGPGHDPCLARGARAIPTTYGRSGHEA